MNKTNIKMLLVDDEEDIQLLINRKFRYQIKNNNFEFDFALSGEKALSKIQKLNYDIIFTDLNMPGMDGLALLKKIKLIKPLSKVIIISAYSDMSSIRTAMNNGAYDFIVKPIDFTDMKKTIKKTALEIQEQKINIKTKKENIKINNQLDEIINTSQLFSSLLDTEKLLKEIVNKIIKITKIDNVQIFLYDENKDEYSSIKKENNKNKIPEDFFKQVKSGNKVIFKETDSSYHIAIPLIFENDFIGIIYLEDVKQITLENKDIELLIIFGTLAAISLKNERKNSIIKKQLNDTVQILHSLISVSSSKVYEYSIDILKYATLLAEKIGLPENEIERIKIAAMIHDISIVGLLEKPYYGNYPLNKKEKKLIQKHPERTIKILEHLSNIDDIKTIIMQHHERHNGSGYPNGLKGEEITIGARIINLVYDFSKVIRKTSYQTEDKKQKVINYLLSNKNEYYDPELVDKFIELIQENKIIRFFNLEEIKAKHAQNQSIWEIPSNINYIPPLIAKIIDKIINFSLKKEIMYFIEYSLSEVIRNAIIHGNNYNASKKVRVEFENYSEEKSLVLNFLIKDQGLWEDIEKHNRFSDARKQILEIFKDIKTFQAEQGFKTKNGLNHIIDNLNDFIKFNYADYNIFQNLKDEELSGGIGLIQVKNFFDEVEFNNIIEKGKIIGTEVKLLKKIEI